MASEASSLKKIAVLTGLTMLMGGAEVSGAAAATTTPQVDAFTFTIFPFQGTATQLLTPAFEKFDSSLGTLTSVDFGLDSSLSGFGTATISVDSVQLSSQNFNTDFTVPYDASFTGLVGAANAAFYTGSGTFNALLTLSNNSEVFDVWTSQTSGSGETGLTLTYDYTPTPTTTTPLPGTLPLLATGLGGLGLAAWRRRKQKSAV